MAIDSKTLAAARKYTDQSVAGGGAIKGKNCVVDSIISITGGHRVTFKWTLDDGTVQTNYMDVMDGADGRGIDSVNVDANNHLIVTYDDGTNYDAGEIQVTGQTIQRNVLPTASASELGNIYQYIGATDANYTNGYFYQCVADGAGYKWENKKVQAGGGSGADNFKDLDDVSFSNLSDGDIPVYDDVNDVWKNSGQIPLAISQLQGSMLNKADKTEIPTKTSQLTNDSNFIADANYVHTDNNYTNADKTALNTTIPLDITQLKASDLRLQLAISQLQGSMLNKADKVSGATANDIALLDASGNLIDSGKKIEDVGGNTILPTPGGSSATESGVVNVVQNATNSSEDVPSLYGIQKWSNRKTFRRVMDGSAAGTLISATGIGTWSDDPVPSEADWWQDAAFIIPDNADDVDISFKFDPTGDAVALGGYILDTTTGKLCIKFANSVTVATCRVAVDITYTRTEVV